MRTHTFTELAEQPGNPDTLYYKLFYSVLTGYTLKPHCENLNRNLHLHKSVFSCNTRWQIWSVPHPFHIQYIWNLNSALRMFYMCSYTGLLLQPHLNVFITSFPQINSRFSDTDVLLHKFIFSHCTDFSIDAAHDGLMAAQLLSYSIFGLWLDLLQFHLEGKSIKHCSLATEIVSFSTLRVRRHTPAVHTSCLFSLCYTCLFCVKSISSVTPLCRSPPSAESSWALTRALIELSA